MSPSEDDLRASLHRGEGASPDTDRIVAAGGAARAQRRNRITGVAASVVLVAAAATVTGVLAGRDDAGSDTAAHRSHAFSTTSPDAIAPSSGGTSPAGPAGRAAPGGSNGSDGSSTAVCPASFPQRLLPGGGSSQFGRGPLFSSHAVSILVCSYGASTIASTRSVPARLVLTGDDASTLQRSLENARTDASASGCAMPAPDQRRNLAFVATAADGSGMRVVTAMLPGCGQRVTNGSAVRFDWDPPSSLEKRLLALVPDGDVASLPSRSPSGKNIGTPTR